jgi:predicted MFS family arabinose efflux permease
MLSSAIEVPIDFKTDSNSLSKNPIKLFLGLHQSQSIVLKLSLLFMIDSFAGSFLLQSLISSWFYDYYNTSIDDIGKIIFVCNLIAGFSALIAVSIAKRIGLVLTMVVTHLPSNVLTMLVPLMPTEGLAIFVLIARYSISQMDVPTRNAYVQGVVSANERSAASGVTNMAKTIGVSIGPYFAGFLYGSAHLSSYPWFIAGVLKIVYDLLLLYSFQSVKPSTEK